MVNKFKFGNKEKCPCNSGKIYEDCCKIKKSKTFHTQGELLNTIVKIMKKSKVPLCLYQGCDAKGKNIIGAHALQENRILNKLQIDKYVYMQDISKNPEMIEVKEGRIEPFYFLRKVHIKDATVAKCFCNKHDDAVFSMIEKTKYSLNKLNNEQLFLFAYKTFAFELYKEISVKKFKSNVFDKIPQITKQFISVYDYRETISRLSDLEYYKKYFDESITLQRYDKLETVVIEIPFRIQFANYMTIAPMFDIRGRKIKNIDKLSKRMKFVFFTIFPNEDKSYILASVLNQDLDAYGEFFKQLRTLPLPLIKYYINLIIPLYSENLIISPKLWDDWTELGQKTIQTLVADPQSRRLLRYIKCGLKNLDKSNGHENIRKIASEMAYDFFIPYEKNC